MAAFGVGVLGLQAANKNLEVIGNNVANASTVGFKQSRVEFGDLYAKSGLMFGAGKPGSGVKVSDISQQFSQGGTTYTQNSLDLALDGNGFFPVKNVGTSEVMYTRAGTFGVDKEGYVITNDGFRLQGYTNKGADKTDITGISGSGNEDLTIPVGKGDPKGTSKVTTAFNLDYSDAAPATTTFDKDDPTSYNYVYTSKLYDSMGYEHDLQQYFVRDSATANSWSMYTLVDGLNPDGSDPAATAPTAETLGFQTDGLLDTATTTALPFTVAWTPSNPSGTPGLPAVPQTFTLDLTNTTQFTGDFSVNELSQNGYPAGELSGIDVDGKGYIHALYSNGVTEYVGQVAVANFRNEQGLIPVGGTNWRSSLESGMATINPPGTGAAGMIESMALEDSNVDLSQELVKMILAQRDYQANAKTIQTADTITQTIINMR